MTLLEIFGTSFLVGFTGAMMPGPLLVVGISETPRHGWLTGPVIVFGHGIVEALTVALLAFGLITVTGESWVARAIAIIGGLALIAMAVMMVVDILRGKVSYNVGEPPRAASRLLVGKGATATLSNPYWWVWWGTVGLALVLESKAIGVVTGPVVFFVGHILSDLVWYTIVAVLIWSGRKLLFGWPLKTFLVLAAAFLIYLGGTFIYVGLTDQIAL